MGGPLKRESPYVLARVGIGGKTGVGNRNPETPLLPPFPDTLHEDVILRPSASLRGNSAKDLLLLFVP